MRLNGLDSFQMVQDEYQPPYIAQRIQETGLPLTEAGHLFAAFAVYDYFLSVVLGILGMTLYNGRLISVIASVFSIIFTYQLGKNVFSQRAALLAASFLAFSTLQYDFSRYFYCYTFLQAEAVVFFWFFYKGYFQNRKQFIYLSTFIGGLILWTHPFSIFYLPGFYFTLIPQKRYKTLFEKELLPNLLLLIILFLCKTLFLIFPSLWSFVLGMKIYPREEYTAMIIRPYRNLRIFFRYWRHLPIPFWVYSGDFVSNLFLIFVVLNFKSQKKYLNFLWIPFLFCSIVFILLFGKGALRYHVIFIPFFALVASDSFFDLADRISIRISRHGSFRLNKNLVISFFFGVFYIFNFSKYYQTTSTVYDENKPFYQAISFFKGKVRKGDVIVSDFDTILYHYWGNTDYNIMAGRWASGVRKEGVGLTTYLQGTPLIKAPKELESIIDKTKKRVWVIIGWPAFNRYYGTFGPLLKSRFKLLFHKRDEKRYEALVFLYDPEIS